MMGELERSHIDRNSPIWGGSDCDYYDLSLEVESYWIGFFKNELNLITEDGLIRPIGIEGKKLQVKRKGTIFEYRKEEIVEHKRIMAEFEKCYSVNIKEKTEEYFEELWRDVSKVGFDLENSDHCIDTCNTLIREEVEWWDERKDLRRYQALKVPGLLEYHSWDVIWRLCKYHKLVAHPLYNHASKRQSVLKKDLPKNAPRIGLKINLNMKQLGDLYQGLFELELFANEHKSGQFLKAVNGSEHKSIIEPMKFKNNGVLALVIMFLRNYQFIDGAYPQYSKWQLFFGIEKTYARKLVSDYGKKARLGEEAKTHRTLPQEYDKLKSLFEAIANKK